MFEKSIEYSIGDDTWIVDPNDDHTWIKQVVCFGLLILALIAALAFWRWMNPPPVVVRVAAPESVEGNLAVFVMACGAEVRGLLFVGSEGYKAMILSHQVPPRCRNVPKGAGCIDWLEPGEKGWTTDGAPVYAVD